MITEKEIREHFPITGEVVMEENKTYEEVTKANFHRRQGAIWLLQKQVSVEPVVKVLKPTCENCKHFIAYDLQKDLQSACVNKESDVTWIRDPEFFGCTFFEKIKA